MATHILTRLEAACGGRRSATPLSVAMVFVPAQRTADFQVCRIAGFQTRMPFVNLLRSIRRRSANLKTSALPVYVSFLLSVFCFQSFAKTYTIDWYKIAGGGGTSTGGTYQVSGTLGQPDASAAMTGGSYSLTGGFWSLISVVQTVGVPNLRIVPVGPNSVSIQWPNTGSYTLQQNSNLAAPAGWTTSAYSITTANGTNSITISPPTGNLFLRLSNP
jgi:hypothetical protein